MQDQEVKICELPAMRVVASRYVGPYPELKPAFEKLHAWAADTGRIESGMFLGIFYDDPRETLPEQCRADVCVTLEARDEPALDPGQSLLELPAGKFAVWRCSIEDGDCVSAWDWLAGEWFPRSGLELEARPCVEIYHHCAENGSAGCEMELCLPVK